jgi:hypothetical protein
MPSSLFLVSVVGGYRICSVVVYYGLMKLDVREGGMESSSSLVFIAIQHCNYFVAFFLCDLYVNAYIIKKCLLWTSFVLFGVEVVTMLCIHSVWAFSR